MHPESAHAHAQPKLQKNGPHQDEDNITSERKRLARLIGRLLARQWLRDQEPTFSPQPTDHTPSG